MLDEMDYRLYGYSWCGVRGYRCGRKKGRQEALLEVKAHAVYSCEWRGTEECTLLLH